VVQRLAAAGGETAFLLTILPNGKGERVMIVSVPLGGYLVPGIEFSVDGRKPFRLLVETCNASGCHAGFALSGRADKELRTGRQAAFKVWRTKDKPVEVGVPLDGLAEAVRALDERS
jgi:invasion protein IalB